MAHSSTAALQAGTKASPPVLRCRGGVARRRSGPVQGTGFTIARRRCR